jgi:hypothetical protein
MTYNDSAFKVIAADAGSAALKTKGKFDKWISCIGLSAGTGTVQFSRDGSTNWTTLKDAAAADIVFAADGSLEIPNQVPFLRILGASLAGASFTLHYATTP